MDRVVSLGVDRTLVVDRFADHVEDASQGGGTHGHRDGLARIRGVHAAAQTVGAGHGHRAHPVVAQVLLHFEHDAIAAPAARGERAGCLHLNRVIYLRQLVGRELDVHYWACYLYYFSC